MPLSEHEQRMLEQIESALYAEDPKFASQVRGKKKLRGPSSRRRWQAVALLVVGLALLVGGLILPKVGGFPIFSLVGFLAMFIGALLALRAGGALPASAGSDSPSEAGGSRASSSRGAHPKKPGISQRMEERFRRRYEQGDE